MKKSLYTLLFILLSASGILGQLPHLIFHVELKSQELVPPGASPARGLITLMYSPDRSTVTVSGMVVDLQGDITGVQLHLGKTGENGPAVLDLTPLVHGRRLYGDTGVPPILLGNLLHNNVYAQVSSNANPGGEIRGTFICETDLDHGCVMTPQEVLPATTSQGFGFGGIHFPVGSRDIVYAFLVDSLSSPITEADICRGQPGENGPVVYQMPSIFLNFVQGITDLNELPPDFLRDLRDGQFYVLIKTENFPDGEIRGQLNFLGFFTSFAPINPGQQTPGPGPTPGFGFSHNVLNTTLDSMTTTVYVSSITPTSVDIRIAPPGMTGPVFETLDPTPNRGVFTKTYPLSSDRLTDFAEGRLYIEVPTAAHPNGEIRGQMKNSLRKGYAFDLCGDQVVPPVSTNGVGVAMASVDQANCYLNYKVIYDRLSSNLVDGYVCQAPPGMNGNALYALPVNKPLIPGQQEIQVPHGVAIEAGDTYMILRTENYPEGEIRGQIRRGLSCPVALATHTPALIQEVAVSPVPFRDYMTLQFSSETSEKGRIMVYDILGAPALVQPVDIVPGRQEIRLSTAVLRPGVYTVSLDLPGRDKSILLKKTVKN